MKKVCGGEADANFKLLRKRASQRWSALVSQHRSRLGQEMGMRMVLGGDVWNDFVAYATANWKSLFVDAFVHARLACTGCPDGSPCPLSYHLDRATAISGASLARLHLDHVIPVECVCRLWKQCVVTLPLHQRAQWHTVIDRDLVCHLLFGMTQLKNSGGHRLSAPNLVLRCGPDRRSGRAPNGLATMYCHRLGVGFVPSNRIEANDLLHN